MARGAPPRSRLSADTELRHVGPFCHLERLTPSELVELGRDDPSRLREVLVRYAQRLTSKGRLASYVTKTFVGIKSWLRFNHVPFDDFPRLKVIPGESIRDERVPTQDELRLILSAYSARGRVIVLFMAHTGVRPGVLAPSSGEGLRLGGLKDLALKPSPHFERLPFHVVVPGRLSRTSVEYHTFGTPELADAMVAYLAQRRSRGEVLSPSSPVVAVDPQGAGTKLRKLAKNEFVSTPVMMRSIREGLKTTLPNARTYVFRAYCSTQMVSARIDRDVREAILGHSLGVSGPYNLSKKLPPSVIEELRTEYAKAIPPLESGRPKEDRTSALQSVVSALLRREGVDESKIVDNLQDKVSPEELAKILRSRAARAPERVVPIGGVEELLAQGWEYVSPLGQD